MFIKNMFHFQIRFIHETYENLTVIYHVLENVGEVFDVNGTNILKRVKNLLCLMHQENNRFHCPKKALTFSATTSCKRNKIKSFNKRKLMSEENCSESKCIERKALSDTRKTREMLQKTLSFWKKRVGYKRDHLFLRRKCRSRRNKKVRKGKRRPSKRTSKSREGRQKTKTFIIDKAYSLLWIISVYT